MKRWPIVTAGALGLVGASLGWVITGVYDRSSQAFGFWIVAGTIVAATLLFAGLCVLAIWLRAKYGPKIPWPPLPLEPPVDPKRPAGVSATGPGSANIHSNIIEGIPEGVDGIRTDVDGDSNVSGNRLSWRYKQ